jgi:predicted nucleic acid-binding protein
MTLVDAGPLVALIDADDQHHEECRAALKRLRTPLWTAWPAVAEAMYLLESFRAQDALWEMLLRDAVRIASPDRSDMERMRQLMHKYRDLPMDLADAALVALAEREHVRKVFTIDHQDFRVYRPKHIRQFELVP